MSSPIPSEPRTGKRKCVAGKFPAAMPIPARSIPTRTGRQSWSNGASTELVTLGRAVAPPVPTPIREGRTQLRKCFGSFEIILPSHAITKLRFVSALDKSCSVGRRPSGFAPECTVASVFLRPIFFASKKKALANRLAIARRSGDEELPRC
jgi:hypothetical protein